MNAHLRTNTDCRELSDGYALEIYRSGPWRVIESACRWQWIIQRRTRAAGQAGPRWKAELHFRTRNALLLFWTSKTGNDGSLLAALLPAEFGR